MATKLNVNIRTLLTNCEDLAKDELNFWRLKKFIKALDTMIDELNDFEDAQSSAKIPDYIKRLEALKAATNYIDSPPTTTTSGSRLKTRQPTALENSDDALKEVRQLQATKQYSDLRRDLLNEDTLRRRKDGPTAPATDNMNEAMKYYNDAQEKIAEHMLSLTRNLKEQTITANRIIRKDTEVVSRSAGLTDRNINSLHKETAKLDQHNKNAWKCWWWMMIFFVIAVFIGMVLFMKIVKKS